MTNYCTVADVKPILQIVQGEAGFDSEIENCIESASALVDGLLAKEDLAAPASAP